MPPVIIARHTHNQSKRLHIHTWIYRNPGLCYSRVRGELCDSPCGFAGIDEPCNASLLFSLVYISLGLFAKYRLYIFICPSPADGRRYTLMRIRIGTFFLSFFSSRLGFWTNHERYRELLARFGRRTRRLSTFLREEDVGRAFCRARASGIFDCSIIRRL